MNQAAPILLQDDYVVLEPLSLDHVPALEAAAADGELWNLMVTSVPPPGQAQSYVEKALRGQAEGHMLPFAVREKSSGDIVGSSRCYEIDTTLPR
ncbi:MAG: GNAT family N-acetyltransferase, partial [Burkholderiales bacterium]